MIAQLWEHVVITIVGMHRNSTQLRTLYQESKSYQTHTKMLRNYVGMYFGSEMTEASQILLKSEKSRYKSKFLSLCPQSVFSIE